MALWKYMVPALMASGLAVAQSDPCDGGSKPISIKTQSDADALNTCTTIKGGIAIDKSASGTLTFSGIEQVTGDFTALSATNVTSITASNLGTVSGKLDLEGIILLTTLRMDNLTNVGSIILEALPNLQALTFTKGVNKVGSLSVTNTGLTSLQGINVTECGQFDLTANNALTQVDVNSLTNLTGLLTLSNNSPKLNVSFPELVGGVNMTFRNIGAVSVPSLESLSGQLALVNTIVNSFSAPNLTHAGDLSIDENNSLTKVSFPQLTSLSGGLLISNNSKLNNITGFPKLKTVTGAVDITGNYTDAALPSLQTVNGGLNAQSNGNFSCSSFQTFHDNGVVKGSFNCTASTSNPTTMNGGSGSSSTTAASTTSSGAAVSNMGSPVGLTAIVGGLLALLM